MTYIIIIIVAILLLGWISDLVHSFIDWLKDVLEAIFAFCKLNWYVPLGLIALILFTMYGGGAGFVVGLLATFFLYRKCKTTKKKNENLLKSYLNANCINLGKTTYNQVISSLQSFANKNYSVPFEDIVKDFLSEIEREHYSAINTELWTDVIDYVSNVLTGDTSTIEIDNIIKNSGHDFSWTHLSTEHALIKTLFERNVDDVLSDYSLDTIPQKKGGKLVEVDAITKNESVEYFDEEDFFYG